MCCQSEQLHHILMMFTELCLRGSFYLGGIVVPGSDAMYKVSHEIVTDISDAVVSTLFMDLIRTNAWSESSVMTHYCVVSSSLFLDN